MNRCFVVGPIGDKMAPIGSPRRQVYEDALRVFEDVIMPACAANDLEPVRADGIAVPGEITEQIFRHLYEDEVVIADVSGGNANVMYELGLRHTRNLLTIQIGEYGQLPFDVATLRTIMFSRSERGLIDARESLEQALRVGLAEGSDPLPATRMWLTRGGAEAPSSAEESIGPSDEPTETDEDFADDRGIMERIVDLEEQFPVLTESIEKIGIVLEQLGSGAEEMAGEMDTVNSSGAPASARLAIISRYAQTLKEPADSLTEETTNFAKHMREMDSAVKGILTEALRGDGFDMGDVDSFIDGIEGLAQGTREGMAGLNEFGTIVGNLGRISRALRAPGKQMGQAVRTMADAAALIDDWEALAIAVRRRAETEQDPVGS